VATHTSATPPRRRPAEPTARDTWFADPDTTDEAILRFGIHDRTHLDAIMVRAPKSAAIIGAIIDATISTAPRRWLSAADGDVVLIRLLDETALRNRDLRAIAGHTRGRAGASLEKLVSALCAHPLVDTETVISCLWNAPVTTAAAVGWSTGELLAAVVSWVVRGLDDPGRPRERRSSPTAGDRARITAVAHRWATLTAGEPALASFVVTSSFNFTDEDDMFAAGRAIASAPAAT